MQKSQLVQNVILLQSYCKFLYLGKYLEQEIKMKDFSKNVKDSKIATGEKSYFLVKGKMIQSILETIYKNPDKKNLYGYLTEISAFRGIVSTMKELLDNEPVFVKFLETSLKKQYFAFEQIIKLIRNVLSHAITPQINFKTADFVYQKTFLLAQKKPLISLEFRYADCFKEWKGNKEYGLSIEVDFKKLKDWASLFDEISLHQLYLLSELCFNISEIFRMRYKLK